VRYQHPMLGAVREAINQKNLRRHERRVQ